MPIRRYAEFGGRSRRREFWWFFLFQLLVHSLIVILFFAGFFAAAALSSGSDFGLVWIVFFFGFAAIWFGFTAAMIIPNAAVISRRMQDLNMPGVIGWGMYVACFVFSFVGLIILVFMAMEGNKGDNQFGLDPKMDQNVAAVFD